MSDTDNNYSIVQTNQSQLDTIIKINEQCLPENYPRFFWNSVLSYNKSYQIVDNINNKIFGYCLCGKGGKTILSFAMLPEYRNRGFGKKLLIHTVNKNIQSQTNKSIILHVRESNSIAQKLYFSVGFKIDKIIDKYYINENGIQMVYSQP